VNQAIGPGEPARDWRQWHEQYDDPDSSLSKRLRVVQQLIGLTLDDAPAGPLRAIGICAGQGRDLLGVLATHPRRDDVSARLVELNPELAAAARAAAASAGLEPIEIVEGDAGLTDAYAGAVPADLVLCCGVFGNVSEDDIHATVSALPMLCAAGATVIWTRGRRPPDLTPTVRRWFAEAGFSELDFIGPDDDLFGVGRNRWSGESGKLVIGRRLFTFL
jgi:hypothetical protein